MPSLIAYPPTLPAGLVQGRTIQQVPNAQARGRDMGESRMRPRYRRSHEAVSVSWVFTQPQFDTFDGWYEDDLLAGSGIFDIELQGRGADPFGLLWYTAQFVGDYSFEHIPQRLYYRVTATLRLVEELGAVRVPPGIDGLGLISFGGDAAFAAPALVAIGSIAFTGGAEMFMPEPEATGIVTFSGAAEFGSGPADITDRHTEAGVLRDAESGDMRSTG